MKISRHFSQDGQSPYAGIDFDARVSEIKNPDGSTVFRQEGIAVPQAWSAVATDILAQKYFRKSGVPLTGPDGAPLLDKDGRPVLGGERDARQVFHRLAGAWTHWGDTHGYFDTPADARTFYDEICHMLAAQVAAPNSPQWFNTGLHWAYGLSGPAQGHYYVEPDTGVLDPRHLRLRAPATERVPALSRARLHAERAGCHRRHRHEASRRSRGLRRPPGGRRNDARRGRQAQRRESRVRDRAQEWGLHRGDGGSPRAGHGGASDRHRLVPGGRAATGHAAAALDADRGHRGLGRSGH